MGLFTKLNYNTIDWNIDTTDFQFVKLSSFKKDDVITIKGFFTIKDNLNGGYQPLAITENCFINLPKNKIDTIDFILSNEEYINAIKNGQCKIKVTKYIDKKHGAEKECTSFVFID